MKLIFDPNQSYQQDAIRSVTDLFEGQPLSESSLSFDFDSVGQTTFEKGVGNNLVITEEQILDNLKEIQKRNELTVSSELDGMNFSVEMETGTGKTYVYLRTIYELHSKYGFKKFVIVVPSVPIREGVLKNLQITHEHLQKLYDKPPVHFDDYKRKNISYLRSYATNNNIEILVINIDSFAKDLNIINQPNDKLTGQKPIEFVQAVRPIVIVDEPQNMETDIRKGAIQNLNPLCTLRYSATHLNLYNLTYSLDPVKAYDLGLVKQIEVDSVFTEDSHNEAYIALKSVNATKTRVTAKITIDINAPDGVLRKDITVKPGDDLFDESNEREIYRDGYMIEELDAANQSLTLTNGNILNVGETQGGLTDEIMKFQIEKTIDEHFKKEKAYQSKGIKVLSLIFIDRVANYRYYDESGNPVHGKFATWFEEIYNQYSTKPAYESLIQYPVERVHNGYFSQDKKGKIKDTSGETQADDDTYKLIMRDKEKLLDIENPLRFIFSHSALKEGWDNPNVFQICTLNETKSERRKRQEIGRGLRLAVDQSGKRTYKRTINKLTVIANESYEDFARALQRQIESECRISFEGRIKNKRNRTKINHRKGFEADPKFLDIWNRIKHKTTYRVQYDTEALIEKASKNIQDLPAIKSPKIKSVKTAVEMDEKGVAGQLKSVKTLTVKQSAFQIPDVLGYIQNRTELTRFTILSILKSSGRIGDILVNPQLFLDQSVKAIKDELYELMIEGIKYERIGNTEYEMRLFEENEIETYLDRFYHEVKDADKTIYDNFIPLDSDVECDFAKDCESSEQVEFYFKLPGWFEIATPIGSYNPDWALIFKDEKKIYFVAETKSTKDLTKLRNSERLKIKCGAAHFNEFEDVEYQHVVKLEDLSN